MKVWQRLFLGGLVLCPHATMAAPAGEMTTYIHTDNPPGGIAADANDITQPFFAAPSTANEVMEKTEELTERLQKLEERVDLLEKNQKEAS